jgi:hypothetical protein
VHKKVPIEDVKKGDRIYGLKVVEVLHRCNGYVRLVLEGGRDIVDGYRARDKVVIDR